jgi:predicted lysophospholipase L1 biosynthesis ABC-type transport system permease subunit
VRGAALDQPPDETVFLPLVTAPGPAGANGAANGNRWAPRNLAFVVRSRGNSRDVTAGVERTMRALAPALPAYGLRAMENVVARSTARTSFTLELLELASVAALAIGAVGLYGVVSYMVGLRTREMAVRMALGAQAAGLRWLVLRQAGAVAAMGIVLGTGVALIVTRFLSALLFDVGPTDPVALLGAAVALATVAGVASWVPARRAAATAPASILRGDG